MSEPVHCDDYVEDPSGDPVARWFIFVNRLPASLKLLALKHGCDPKLFADYQGKRVRVTMASRLGDLGITHVLTSELGYSVRVSVTSLSNFSDTPLPSLSAGKVTP